MRRSIKEMDKRLDEREQEIERLNNIINKATDYMTETIDFSWKDNSPIKNGKSLSLNKLYNILKGSDK